MNLIERISLPKGRARLTGAPEGVDALALASLAGSGPTVLHVSRDDARMARLADTIAFFAPDATVVRFPAWDCLPYDRVSPSRHLQSQRAAILSRLAEGNGDSASGTIVVTTVSAVLQKVAPKDFFAGGAFSVRLGERLDADALLAFLGQNGFTRAGTVREPGEYAVRGGIIDVYAPDGAEPLRIDLFGDEVETIRRFDPVSQRTTGEADALALRPVSEVHLDEPSISRFRSGYRELFGAGATDDPIYEAVSAGRAFSGMEHWLPLFHDGLVSVLDYLPDAAITCDHQIDEAIGARLDQIADYYAARVETAGHDVSDSGVYRPLPPDRLFFDRAEWDELSGAHSVAAFSPFPKVDGEAGAIEIGGRRGVDFAEARARPDASVFDALAETIADLRRSNVRAALAAYSAGSRDRLAKLAEDHGITGVTAVDDWQQALAAPSSALPVVVLGLEHGFVVGGVAVITEQDVLGDRMVRPSKRRKRAEDVLTELSSLEAMDFVVHVDHGIGRYEGLETIDVVGAPHDCLRLTYDGGDRLFLPVENMDMLSRYGSADSEAQLDRLGGAGWQARKARVKERIAEMADQLLAVAAERELRSGQSITPAEGLYDEFAARFPYIETDDQRHAIDDVIADLGSGRPMDRLVCGDVGFGKTEVALRAAFVSVMAGHQVAVVVPTTLLARQHFRTFKERFAGLPVVVEQLSRLVGPKDTKAAKDGIAGGTVDIVIGTHALLGSSIAFKDLGLLIVDEEQHFGVKQKERLKELRANVHVLTLTATPIPRTLQMALSGVREMSLMASPPVDRLAVRTFVLPYDPVVIREAIEREIFRGGQVYYVCPRIADIPVLQERLAKLVPDVHVGVAHGQMPPSELEDVMAAFYDGKYQILLATNIIESGLDIPSVNTIIIHRSDMFGLAQLYQLRGRVGRSKVRAYAYLTIPADRMLGATAEKRLQVMQTLDSLGAGFSLASYDLDIRGAGNLLGEEQSGHIREVGIELYQQMLEEAVAAARDRSQAVPSDAEPAWSPQIAIGMPVLIPEAYVQDLTVRLGLYRRIASLVDGAEIEGFAAELIDRFGPLPAEVENLLEIVAIKRLCLKSGVDKVDAGPKGAILSFHNDSFARPEKLVHWLQEQGGAVKLRPDHKLVYRRQWDQPAERIKGVRYLVRELAEIAA